MFFEIMIAIFLGIVTGIFTGLSPGIHVNLVSSILLSVSPKLGIDYFIISIYIVALAISHTIFDTIPGVFLGAPDESNITIALPAHKMLFEGRGKEAVFLSVFGCFLSVLFTFLLIFLFNFLFRLLYEKSKSIVGYLLILIIIYMIFFSKKKFSMKLLSLIIFLLSGILGIITFMIPIGNVLMPLLSGLFGVSGMILGISDDVKIPLQKENKFHFEKNSLLRYIIITFVSVLLASVSAFLPGFSTSHTAIFAGYIVKDIGNEGYMVMNGAINTANMAISLITFHSIKKARNGAIVTISELLHEIDFMMLVIFFLVMILVTSISSIFTIVLSDVFVSLIPFINYKLLALFVIFLVLFFCVIFSGIIGVIILISSSSLGILCSKYEIAKNNLLGCLILPVILYFI